LSFRFKGSLFGYDSRSFYLRGRNIEEEKEKKGEKEKVENILAFEYTPYL